MGIGEEVTGGDYGQKSITDNMYRGFVWVSYHSLRDLLCPLSPWRRNGNGYYN